MHDGCCMTTTDYDNDYGYGKVQDLVCTLSTQSGPISQHSRMYVGCRHVDQIGTRSSYIISEIVPCAVSINQCSRPVSELEQQLCLHGHLHQERESPSHVCYRQYSCRG